MNTKADRPNAARTAGLLALGIVVLFAGCSGQADTAAEAQYRRFLPLSQVKSSFYTEPETHTKYPLIEGSLSNLGSQTVIVVEFTLRFKDNVQNIIYEEHAYPVFVSNFANPAANQALAPGQKTRFAFKAPKCPPGWQPGNIDIEITKIVFAGSTTGTLATGLSSE